MKIRDTFSREDRSFSFEFYPPKSDTAVERLFGTAKRLQALAPNFVSVTYGAGGSTRDGTLGLCERLGRDLGLTAMCHLTCVGHTRSELVEVLGDIASRGIENLMVLRGDPPAGAEHYEPVAGGLRYAAELVALARETGDFGIGVAGYPETHQECASPEADLEHLKRKVDAGADFVVTQLFFENRDYFDFRERCERAGIDVRIVPGIMPVINGPQIRRIAKMCGASIPEALGAALDAAGEDAVAAETIGTEWAEAQCDDLLRQGAPGIHFYTMNRSAATERIFAALRADGAPLAASK